MERSNTVNSFVKPHNKGFTIHLGDEYVGHLTINEDRVAPATVANLQKPEIMKMILAEAELRKYVPKEERANRNTSAMDSIIAKANAPAEVDDIDSELADLIQKQTA